LILESLVLAAVEVRGKEDGVSSLGGFRVSAQEFVLRRESAEQFLKVRKLAEHVAVVAQDYRFCAHEVRILRILRSSLPVRPGRKTEEMS